MPLCGDATNRAARTAGSDGAEARLLMVLTRVTVFARSGSSVLIVPLAPTVPVAVSLALPSTVTTRAADRPIDSWVNR